MKFVTSIEGAHAARTKTETMSFGKTGEENLRENEKCYAKIVVKNGIQAYSIKTYNGELYDPHGSYSNRENVLETKMERATREVFDFYMMYLKTRKGIYLTRAQRSFLNVGS